jgi:GNAT superfamily N-acetyltransferase
MFEQTVAAAIVLQDPRRRDNTAYLALWHIVNDTETAERFLDKLAELMWTRRCRRLIGPTGLSPHLGAGLLEDCWDRTPPLHTAYDPPYVPEIVHSYLTPVSRSHLYHLEIPPEPAPVSAAPADLEPLAPERLATDLLPLLVAACPIQADFPPPDGDEAAFLLRRLARWPLYGWLAQVEGQPVGFVLLQPDLADRLKRAGGGRNPAWRLWLLTAAGRRTGQGRLLYGGVLPDWRGRGIGRQLLHQSQHTARDLGWRSLSAGPLPPTSAGARFLEKQGGRPEQTYGLYQRDL